MIPDRVVELLHGPAFMQVGTRDAQLRPAHAWVIGALVDADRETVTFFVPESRSARVLSNLQDNGRVALGLGLASHEAYQLKGTYLSSRTHGRRGHRPSGDVPDEVARGGPPGRLSGGDRAAPHPRLRVPAGRGRHLPGEGNLPPNPRPRGRKQDGLGAALWESCRTRSSRRCRG